MKKFLSLILALVAIATTARAQTDYGFYVGGVRVNSSNASNITGSDITSGRASYNHSNKTLTLNGVTITRTGSSTNSIENVSCAGLKIVFQGTNNLTNSGGAAVLSLKVETTIECAANSTTNLTQNSSSVEAIYFFGGNLTFQGSGTLNINSNSHGIEGKDATRNVIFNGPTVNVTSEADCLIDIGTVTFRGNSIVKLVPKSSDTTTKRVHNVKNMTFENGQEIKDNYRFDAAQATIVSGNTPITKSTITIDRRLHTLRVNYTKVEGTVSGEGFAPSEYYYNNYGTGTYKYGTLVTLTATPSAGYRFVKWTENGTQVSTSATYTFTITADRTLSAVFEPLSYTVSVSANPTAGGTVTGAGTYQYRTRVKLTATANAGYRFDKWTKKNASTGAFEDAPNDVDHCTENPYKFDMGSANATYRAEFIKTYTVTATSTLEGVTVTGGDTYDTGAQVTVKVSGTIPTGYRFKCWTVNGTSVSTSQTYSFTCTANRELKAVFEYDITASLVPANGGTVSGSALGAYRTDATAKQVTLTATPASDLYWFVRWTENNTQVSTNNPYTFTTDGKPHQFEAEFGLSLLDDDSSGHNQMELSGNNGQKRCVALKNRSLLRGQWNVLCLPFDLSSLTGTPLEGAAVKALASSSYNAGTKTLTMNFENATAIEAGKPYLVYLNGNGALDNPVFNDVTINSATPGFKETDAVNFFGAYSPFVLTAGQRALYMANDGKLYYPANAVQVNAFRAYFQLKNESAGAENMVLNFGNGWEPVSYSLASGDGGRQTTWTVVRIDNAAEAEMVLTRGDSENETVACTTPFTTQTIAPENLTKATLRVATTGESSEYSVYLVNSGSNKVNVIKAVRNITGLGLAEAKALVDSADGTTPVLIKTFATAEEAQAAKQTLEDLNATVTMEEVVTYATSNQSFKVYRDGVDVTAQGTADGNYLCFEVSPDNLANTTWVITTEKVVIPGDVNGDGVVNASDIMSIYNIIKQ